MAPRFNPPSTDEVTNLLRGVVDPELGSDVIDLGMARCLAISPEGRVLIEVKLTIGGCPLRAQIKKDIETRIPTHPGVTDVKIEWGEMNSDERSQAMAKARWNAKERATDTAVPATTRVLAIASGKGGVGKSSVTVNLAAAIASEGYTVGVLVQANYGSRHLLRVDGIPAGRLIRPDEVPAVRSQPKPPTGDGSIIIIVATDAPLLAHQCKRLAQRATIGLARVGGTGADSSGDIFLAFATGNSGLPSGDLTVAKDAVAITMLPNAHMSPLFEACADATEEAILNAMCMAHTTTGIDGRTVHALPLERVVELVAARGY